MQPKNLVQRLYDHYGSDDKVAAVTGIHQTTISRIRRGGSPNWRTYEALLGQYAVLQQSEPQK